MLLLRVIATKYVTKYACEKHVSGNPPLGTISGCKKFRIFTCFQIQFFSVAKNSTSQ